MKSPSDGRVSRVAGGTAVDLQVAAAEGGGPQGSDDLQMTCKVTRKRPANLFPPPTFLYIANSQDV